MTNQTDTDLTGTFSVVAGTFDGGSTATETVDDASFGWRWLMARDALMSAVDAHDRGLIETVGYASVREIVSQAVVDLKAANIAAIDAEQF